MAYRQVDSDWWNEGYVQGDEGQRGLDITERYLWLFITTNPLVNIAGAYKIPMRAISSYTGLTPEQIATVLKRFEADKKVLYRDGLMVIRDRAAANKQDNPNIRKAVDRVLAELPQWAVDFIKPLEVKASPEQNPKIQEKEGGEGKGNRSEPFRTVSQETVPNGYLTVQNNTNTTTNTNTNTPININSNTYWKKFDFFKDLNPENFAEVLDFMRVTYANSTDKSGKRPGFLVISKFEEQDLRRIWEQLPDKLELAAAWGYYTAVLADRWEEYLSLKSFTKRYTEIQQQLPADLPKTRREKTA